MSLMDADTAAAARVEGRPYETEYQRRHASCMEMERRLLTMGHGFRGRVASALNTAWSYRHKALAPSNTAGDRRFWLRLARSAVSRAREDRTKTEPARLRMLTLADNCVSTTARGVADVREAVEG